MALYVESADLMIYHVPKCGGTWVRHALQKWGVRARRVEAQGVSSQHSAPIHHQWHQGPRLVFLRDPITWYESWFRFQVANNWQRWEATRWHPCREVEELREARSYIQWIERVTHGAAPLTTMYDHYADAAIGGRLRIEPFEDLSDALQDALESFDVPFEHVDVPPVNVSRRIDLGDRDDRTLARWRIVAAEKAVYDRHGRLWEV